MLVLYHIYSNNSLLKHIKTIYAKNMKNYLFAFYPAVFYREPTLFRLQKIKILCLIFLLYPLLWLLFEPAIVSVSNS